MIMDINFGSMTSPATSVSIISGPITKALRYGVMYFLYRFNSVVSFLVRSAFVGFF